MGFLKDNKHRWVSDFDLDLFTESDQMEIFLDAILEVFDRLLELGPDEFYKLLSIDDIPDEYINHLSSLVGWRQTDYKFNYLSYRELVKNIVRIYKIKGTRLSYEVFFRAMGYIPQIHELWWDREGNLVRTKPLGAPDPNSNNRTSNRSNIVEIELDLMLDDPATPPPFSDPEFIPIVVDYLKFLKPHHIRYKPILLNLPPVTEVPVLVDTGIPVIIIGDISSPLGVGFDGLFEEQLPGVIEDDFQLYASEEEEDCPNMYYNNTIRYGSSVARSVTLDGVTFPVSVIQRDDVRYGSVCSPIPDELSITIQTEKFLGEETVELRYNNYIYYDNDTVFDTDRTIEISDTLEFGSQQFSFGPGNVWTKPTP